MSAPLTHVSVSRGGALLFEKILPLGEYLIGRDRDAQISVIDDGLLGRHALLGLHQNGWVIEDLGGGTFVNDERVAKRRAVLPTQTIRVGEVVIDLQRVKCEEEADASLPAVSAAVRDLLPPEIRGERKFEIGTVLAQGGMGVIVIARERLVERDVAMKLMRDGGRRGDIERFVREAKVTAQLEHPNIVPVYELGVNELDQPFYTMKLVRGASLKKVLGLLATGDACTVRNYPRSAFLIVFQKVCDAVAFAHSRGVIHRDLKPDNIMLGEYGEVLVMDWGLAKVLRHPSTSKSSSREKRRPAGMGPEIGERPSLELTQNGAVIGTLQYMAPEQASGKIADLNEACDIYALGAILYHILTLRPPVEGASVSEVARNVQGGKVGVLSRDETVGEHPSLSEVTIPHSLRAVVQKAMARDPEDRYCTVKLLQVDIAAYQSGFATSAERASAWKRGSLFIRRHRAACIAAALLLIAAVVSGAMLALARYRTHTAERVAYVADMLEAGRYVTEGRLDSARDLLSHHYREPTGRDLRGWEWFHLYTQLHRDRLRVQAHKGGVYALTVSGDGRRVASGGADGDVAIWRARGLVCERRLRNAHVGRVLSVAWWDRGPLLASGGEDGTVRVWNTETGKLVSQLQIENSAEVRALSWQPLPNGEGGLAIGGSQQSVLFWRPLADESFSEKLVTTEKGVFSLHWSSEGSRLAIGKESSGNNVEVFDFTSRSIVFSDRPTAGETVLTAVFSHSGNYVAAGSKHFAVAVFDLAKGKLIFEQTAHRGFVRDLAWSPDDRHLASASQDGTVRIFEPSRRDAAPEVFCGHVGEVAALAWANISPVAEAGARFALFSGGSDGTLRGWMPSRIDHAGLRTKNWVAAVRWSPDNSRIAAVGFRETLYIIEPGSGMVREIPTPLKLLFDVAWSPRADRLLVASRATGGIAVIDALSGSCSGIYQWPEVEQVVWNRPGTQFVAAGADGIATFNLATDTPIVVIRRAARSITWDAGDNNLIVGASDGAIEVWNPLSGKRTEQWRRPQPVPTGNLALKHDLPCEVLALRISPDKRFVAFGTMDKTAALLNARTGTLIRTFSRHTGGVRGVAWSPDSQRLATCSQDGAIRVFNVETGDLVARIDHGLGNQEIHSIDWSPDGQQLVTGGYDRAVRVWDSSRAHIFESIEELQRRAQMRSTDIGPLRELTEQCAQLGWVDVIRDAIANARASGANALQLDAIESKAEAILARTLDGSDAD